MTRWAKAAALAVAILGFSTSSASAQSDDIAVTANVFQALTVTGTQDLGFGNVFPGVNKTIAPSAATSGRFAITGQASVNVDLTFTLPANLVNGANNLPIGSWAGLHNTSNSTGGATSFTPSGTATTVSLSGAGELFIFIGAQVSPASNQAAGNYTGTVTLTVAYN